MSVTINPVTEVRQVLGQAILDELNSHAPLQPWVLVDGRVTGPSGDKPIISTWPISRFPVAGTVYEEDVRIQIKLLPVWQQEVVPDRPRDPTVLEDLAQTALVVANGEQADLVESWGLGVVSTEFDLDAQGVTLTVVARRWNAFGCP